MDQPASSPESIKLRGGVLAVPPLETDCLHGINFVWGGVLPHDPPDTIASSTGLPARARGFGTGLRGCDYPRYRVCTEPCARAPPGLRLPPN